MEKWFCWASMAVASVLLILFVLDVVLEIPFMGLSTTVDILSIICSVMVFYLGWSAYKEMR